MSRYEKMFEALGKQGRGAFIPFVVIGDPDPDLSLKIILALVEGGADALELGIPFSDPVADGPAIQVAAVRALRKGVTPARCMEIIGQVRKRHPEIPVGLLVYANLVVVNTMDAFYKNAADAGVDSVLVADVPAVEADEFAQSAVKHGIDPVLIAPPNASGVQLETIARLSRGYTYVVARPGVTGVRDSMRLRHDELFAQLKDLNAPPPVLGFGISKPQHVAEAIGSGAAGAISGSAVVKIVEENVNDESRMLAEIIKFVSSMKSAT